MYFFKVDIIKYCLTLGLALFSQSFVSQVSLHHLWEGHTEKRFLLNCPHLMLILCRMIIGKYVIFCRKKNKQTKVRSNMPSVNPCISFISTDPTKKIGSTQNYAVSDIQKDTGKHFFFYFKET